jgi:outer membrane autotransporter protein
MNLCYRTVWNAALGACVAAAENVRAPRGGGARSSSRRARRAGTVMAGAALVASGMAHAATFNVSNENELAIAILSANASLDAASTFNLTASFTSALTLPQIQKNVTVVPNAFVVTTALATPFDVAAGSSLTFQGTLNGTTGLVKSGGGALVLAGVGSAAGGNITVNGGELRVQDGGTLTPGGLSGINATGDNSRVVVTGSGSKVITAGGATNIGSAAGSSLDVLAGAAFGAGGSSSLLLGEVAGTTGNLTVQGSGSNVTVIALLARAGQSNIRVLDGGTLESTGPNGVQLGGTGTTSAGGVSSVVVSGKGSTLKSGVSYTQHRGTLEVSDGATLDARLNFTLGRTAGGVVTGVVAGAGSSLTTTVGTVTVGQEGAATLTVSNGATVSSKAGLGSLALGQSASGSGTLNIGAAVGDAAVAPGTVLASAVNGGAGTAVLNFNHNASAYDFAVPITGGTSVNHVGSGTTTLTGANTYTGATNVAAGTLRAGAASTLSSASAFTVATGATLDLAGNSQTVASMANSGTVSLLGTVPGTTLTVTGPWVGNGGTLRLGTALGTSASASDRLILSGATAIASGTTNVQVTNLGGLGALTSGNGIELISAVGGATTTAQTTKSAFSLAGGHVDAGAYEYRLYAADASGAGENWYLRSTTTAVPPATGGGTGTGTATGGGLVVPTYRAEVPLYAALPEQFREASLAMLGGLRQRTGDDIRPASNDAGSAAPGQAYRQAWGRVISTDRTISQGGTVSPTSKGRLTGFQAGTDLWADPNWRVGVYVGQLDGDMRVTGFASGLANLGVGSSDLRSEYIGAYATWKNGSGLYVDGVLQGGRHRYTASPTLSFGSSGKGDSLLAAIEVGQSFAIAPNWSIEPQLQLVHQRVSLDNTSIVGALVQQDSHDGWLVRAGVRLKGEIATSAGLLQPYVRVNVHRSSSGTDVTRFIGPAGFTDIATRTGGTSTELAGGASWQLSRTTSLYGEVSKLWDLSGDTRTRSGINASVGFKMLW